MRGSALERGALLELGEFVAGGLEDGEVGVGGLPVGEEGLIVKFGVGAVAGFGVGAGEA